MGAAVLSGAFQKVTLGPTSKVLGAGKFSISGATRKTVDVSEFGDDVDAFEFTSADGGTISISPVNLDINNAAQNTLRTNVTTAGGALTWSFSAEDRAVRIFKTSSCASVPSACTA